MKPTEPQFIRDPGSLFTRCVCPLDGTAMHVIGNGMWNCSAALHQWHRYGKWMGQPGGWKLFKTFIMAEKQLPLGVRYA